MLRAKGKKNGDKVSESKCDSVKRHSVSDLAPLKATDMLPQSSQSDCKGGGGGPSLLHAAAVVAKPFLARGAPSRRRAICLFIGIFITMFSQSALLLAFSEVQKQYMNELAGKKAESFYQSLLKAALIILIFLPFQGAETYFQKALKLEWRAAITCSMSKVYLSGSGQSGRSVFYKLHMDGNLDNPDQRICQDVADLVTNALDFLIQVSGSILRMLGFIGVLYQISPTVCIAIFVYSAASTGGALVWFGVRIFKYQEAMTQQEATLRYSLIRVRENAESIAFFKGGATEWTKFQVMFANLVDTTYAKIRELAKFEMFSFLVRYSTYLLPVLLVGPAYMRGELEFGEISQAEFAFQALFNAFMVISAKVPELSSIAVQISRLVALHEVLQNEATKASEASHSDALGTSSGSGSDGIALHERSAEEASTTLEVTRMTLMTPPRQGAPQQAIVSDLSFQLKSGVSLLIVGESGIGKSSLMRGIAGLWSDGCGSVSRCGGGSVFFMPQRPYMCLGTLREQLLYPHDDILSVSTEKMREALLEVKLGYLWERHGLDTVQDWAGILSLGEQQRINFARVLLQPDLRLALLDEGTSACDPENEGRLYAALQRRVKSYVSVGHRPGLRRYHTHALLLQRTSKDGVARPDHDAGHDVPATHSYMPMEEFENLGLLT